MSKKYFAKHLSIEEETILFLCNRDTYYGGTPDKGTYIDISIGTDMVTATKVIGQISSDAIWVKEGDGFTEEEVSILEYAYVSQGRNIDTDEDLSGQIIPMYLLTDDLSDYNAWEYKSVGITVKILCSNCKTFH